jgi:hypothetical protein
MCWTSAEFRAQANGTFGMMRLAFLHQKTSPPLHEEAVERQTGLVHNLINAAVDNRLPLPSLFELFSNVGTACGWSSRAPRRSCGAQCSFYLPHAHKDSIHSCATRRHRTARLPLVRRGTNILVDRGSQVCRFPLRHAQNGQQQAIRSRSSLRYTSRHGQPQASSPLTPCDFLCISLETRDGFLTARVTNESPEEP